MKKIIILVVIVLVILVGFFLYRNFSIYQDLSKLSSGIVTSSSTAPTADWKTHTNEQYGFEFKYPADWKISERGYQDAIGHLSVSVFDPRYGDPGSSIFSNGFTVLVNETCENHDWVSNGNVWSKGVCKLMDSIQFKLVAVDSPAKATTDQILSTFKFTK